MLIIVAWIAVQFRVDRLVVEHWPFEPAGPTVVSSASFKLMLNYEVGGGRLYYEKFLDKPTWPGFESGATIGVGYDLAFYKWDEVRNDWAGFLTPEELDSLHPLVGLRGEAAKTALATATELHVPWKAANRVFKEKTLPRFVAITARTFPGWERLPPDAQGALVSLIFNRGASIAGDRRKEMNDIKSAVRDGNLPAVAQALRDMKRLWPGPDGASLRERREAEAQLVERAIPLMVAKAELER